jgi:pimeloyl-ACP methyl ester carboxylesterase
MPRARNGAVELEYETFGDDRPEAVLLVNGLGSQMTRWPEAFCTRLAAKGYRAIRFDNRDTGLSTWPEGPYTLADMANDAVAVLDAAGVARAHIAGVSMGGMIVQRVAIDHPDRVLSMTSIMSAPGAQGTLMSTPEAMAVLNNPPPDPNADFQAFLDNAVKNALTIGSPGYPWPEGALRARAEAEYRRGFNPPGVARQRAAITADGDRTPELGRLTLPTVVLHGEADPLVQPIGGESTAAAVPGAELRMIPGMGHDVPPALYDIVIDAICAAAARAKTNAM